MLVHGATNLFSLVRGGNLGEAIEPWMQCRYADDIPFERLAAQGIRAVLFDLENTLIPPGGPFTASGRKVVDRARSAGLKVAVVSNASAAWVRAELQHEGIAFVAPAGKPGREAFERGCALIEVDPADAVFVGDQVITDVLGSQRAGLRAILLEPRYTNEPMSARFQRGIVRVLRRGLRG